MFLACLWPSLYLPDVMLRQSRIPSVVFLRAGKSPPRGREHVFRVKGAQVNKNELFGIAGYIVV